MRIFVKIKQNMQLQAIVRLLAMLDFYIKICSYFMDIMYHVMYSSSKIVIAIRFPDTCAWNRVSHPLKPIRDRDNKESRKERIITRKHKIEKQRKLTN